MGKSLSAVDINNISISPYYRVNNWIESRDNEDWDTMIDIFNDRIESRYLKPIRLIASDTSIGEFSGFAIIAIDCLLIETLNQFHLGINETKGKHREAFWNFFKNSQFFLPHFTRTKAHKFYSHFRCGILHQAQTKVKSVIRIEQKTMIQVVENDIKKGLIVDREKFHTALEEEIVDYKRNLKLKPSELRNNFIKKMNFICGV